MQGLLKHTAQHELDYSWRHQTHQQQIWITLTWAELISQSFSLAGCLCELQPSEAVLGGKYFSTALSPGQAEQLICQPIVAISRAAALLTGMLVSVRHTRQPQPFSQLL